MFDLNFLIEKIPAFIRFADKSLNEHQISAIKKIYDRISANAEYSKKNMRSKYRQIRNSINEEQRRESSAKIMTDIIESDFYKHAKLIFVYVSYLSEVDTSRLIEHSLAVGKRVCVPHTLDNHVMLANEIFAESRYVLDRYGIKTPVEEHFVDKSEIDLTIVPGLAFDSLGFRLGYGGGYYDKFLSDYTGTSVGVAYQKCVCDEIIPDTFDIPVDILITG